MSLLYLDAKGSYTDPAKSGLKHLRADAQWAAPDAAHKYLDATGAYSAPALELGSLAPFTLNGIDAAKCSAANKAANGLWLEPAWTESGTAYDLYATVLEVRFEPSSDVAPPEFDWVKQYDASGFLGMDSNLPLKSCTYEYGKLVEAGKVPGVSGGTLDFYSPSGSAQSYVEFHMPEEAGRRVRLTLCSPNVKLVISAYY